MDLTQLYGPGFAGYLAGKDAVRQRDVQGLKGLGMLGNMQRQQEQNELLKRQVQMADLKLQKETQLQKMLMSLIPGQGGAPAASAEAPGASFMDTTPVPMGEGTPPQPAPAPSAPAAQSGGLSSLLRDPNFLATAQLAGLNLAPIARVSMDQYRHANPSAYERAQIENFQRQREFEEKRLTGDQAAAAPIPVRYNGKEYQIDPNQLRTWRADPRNSLRSVQDFVGDMLSGRWPPSGNQPPQEAPTPSMGMPDQPAPANAPQIGAQQPASGAPAFSPPAAVPSKVDLQRQMAIEKKNRELLDGLRSMGVESASKLSNFDAMDQLLDKLGNSTGPAWPLVQSMGNVIRTFAPEAWPKMNEKIGAAEAYATIANPLTLALRQSVSSMLNEKGGGTGMPGAMSDADRDFLQSSLPRLTNSPQGNKLALRMLKAIERRKVEISQMADAYAKDHGGQLDENWPMVLRQFMAKRPMFAGVQF